MGSFIPSPADQTTSLEGRLLFAVPKKGRLLQAALNLLEGADIQFKRENRLDIALVKNLPIALVFLPAADIPTFVGEGRVSLGITGRDQVAEHDAGVASIRRERAASGQSTPEEEDVEKGCEELMDLEFGACKLQVQVPEKGPYKVPEDLIGKNIGTSFVHLAEDYFAALEAKQNAEGTNGEAKGKRKLRTKIIELSGSVEAACALGVADGIVDLVGEHHSYHEAPQALRILTALRIRRNNESGRPLRHRHRRLLHRRPRPLQEPHQPRHGEPHRIAHPRRHHRQEVRPVPVQRGAHEAPSSDEGHAGTESTDDHGVGGGGLDRGQCDGGEEEDCGRDG
jgi:ATP phosphoribosyltransferase